MASVLSLLKGFRPQLLAFVGVLAVAGISTLGLAWLYIDSQKQQIARQSEKIDDLTQINKDWAAWASAETKQREIEKRSVIALQDKLGRLEDRATETGLQLAELEKTNEQIRNYLGEPIPNDLRRLLE